MKTLRAYFDFTKAERNAALLMLIAILLVLAFPYLFRPKADPPSDFSMLLAIAADTGSESEVSEAHSDYEKKPFTSDKPFAFDPNTADENTLVKLGFRPWLAKRVLKFRLAGGRFKTGADLYKLYGADKELMDRLQPFVRITKAELVFKNTYERAAFPERKAREIVELNSADTTALIALPGIGSKLARRIIAFREKLGGFYSTEQLKEVYGLKPEVIDLILPRIRLDLARVRPLLINVLDKDALGTHPYIGYKAAAVLVAYRTQHGAFSDADALRKSLVLNEENLMKLKYYINYK